MANDWSYALVHEDDVHDVIGSEVVVGRSRTCGLRIPDPSVSRRHFRLLVGDGTLTLQDLGSSNGTFVNDQPVHDRLPLGDGDLVRAGDIVFLVQIRDLAADDDTVDERGRSAETVLLEHDFLNQVADQAAAKSDPDPPAPIKPFETARIDIGSIAPPGDEAEAPPPMAGRFAPPAGAPTPNDEAEATGPDPEATVVEPALVDQSQGAPDEVSVFDEANELFDDGPEEEVLIDEPPLAEPLADLEIPPLDEDASAAILIDSETPEDHDEDDATDGHPTAGAPEESPTDEDTVDEETVDEGTGWVSPDTNPLPEEIVERVVAKPPPTPDAIVEPPVEAPEEPPFAPLPDPPSSAPEPAAAAAEPPPPLRRSAPPLDLPFDVEPAKEPLAPFDAGPAAREETAGEDAEQPSPVPVEAPPSVKAPYRRPGPLPPAAGAGARLAAALIEAAWVAALWLGSIFLLDVVGDPRASQVIAAVVLGVAAIVVVIGWALWGTTPGKRALGLYVCTVQGQPGVGALRAIVRLGGYLVSALPLGLGFVSALFGKRRTLHDRLSGTYVARLG